MVGRDRVYTGSVEGTGGGESACKATLVRSFSV